MKKLSILLAFILGMRGSMQPAAAPQVAQTGPKAELAKELAEENKVSWLGEPRQLPQGFWQRAIEWAGLDQKIKERLVDYTVKNRVTLQDEKSFECFAYSTNGKYIVTVSKMWNIVLNTFNGYYSIAKLWDAQTGKEIRTLFEYRGRGGIIAVAFSSDGTHIVTGFNDGMVKVWDVQRNQEVYTLRGHTCDVTSVAYRPDGNFIFTRSKDGMEKIWDGRNGELINTNLHDAFSENIRAVAYSPDTNFIATLNRNEIEIRNAHTGESIRSWDNLHEHAPGSFSALAYSPSGNYIATGRSKYGIGQWGTVQIWDVHTDLQVCRLAHTQEVTAIVYSPDGNYIVIGGLNNQAKLYNVTTGQLITTLNGGEIDKKRECKGQMLLLFGHDNIFMRSSDGAMHMFDISLLNYAFNEQQIEVLKLLDQYYDGNELWLSDIESQDKLVQLLNLKLKFHKIFPYQVRKTIVKTYNIQDADPDTLPPLEDSVALIRKELKEAKAIKNSQKIKTYNTIALAGTIGIAAAVGAVIWYYWNK